MQCYNFRIKYCILTLCPWVCPFYPMSSHANLWLHMAQRIANTVYKQSKAFSCLCLGLLLRHPPQASLNTFVPPSSNQISHSKANPLEHWFNGVESASIRYRRLTGVYKVTQEKATYSTGTGSTGTNLLPYYRKAGILHGLFSTAGKKAFTAKIFQPSERPGPCR